MYTHIRIPLQRRQCCCRFAVPCSRRVSRRQLDKSAVSRCCFAQSPTLSSLSYSSSTTSTTTSSSSLAAFFGGRGRGGSSKNDRL